MSQKHLVVVDVSSDQSPSTDGSPFNKAPEKTLMQGPVPAPTVPALPAKALAPSGAPPSKCTWKDSLRAWADNVRQRPLLLLLPAFLVFSICVALGVYGVVAGAQQYQDDQRAIVHASGQDWVASFRMSFEKSFTPLVTLSLFLQQDPYYPSFATKFPALASQLLALLPANTIQELQVSPMANISVIYPKNNVTDGRLKIDIFNQSALRGGALATIQARQLVLNGPLNLVSGNFGTIARIPVFIANSSANETFGTTQTSPTNCPAGLCYNPVTGEKFWGFLTALSPLDDLRAGNDSRLDVLKQKGYSWKMTRPWTSTEVQNGDPSFTFASTSSLPQDPVIVNVTISNAVWTIELAPSNGWHPNWEMGLIVMVVLVSALLAILVGTITASWARQQQYLTNVVESNQRLEATMFNLEEEKQRLAATTDDLTKEKLRLDTLLVRQYNLISVLGGKNTGFGLAKAKSQNLLLDSKEMDSNENEENSDSASVSARYEGSALNRIESMRRELSVNNASSAQDIESIQTLELLGEGAFGKVYKGLWRGITVAIKTMMLPVQMSGAEKREKMAVMEAAISSSLSHPNIVQTYTYAIKAVRDNAGQQALIKEQTELLHQAEVIHVEGGQTLTNVPSPSMRSTASFSNQSVHSFEVRLVLEYCNRGSLRDALDASALTLPIGPNYLAILEICMDVARAMTHLHTLNILHGDLKARNVLLQNCDSDSMITGKVADFGLSLKMEHMQTHISSTFQGTMSHMAPEILLEGHMSKAADTYAFGVTMWEIFTGGHAYKGIPKALLGHRVTKENLRPVFPPETPAEFKALAERCWVAAHEDRPSFDTILLELLALRQARPQATPPVVLRVIGGNNNNQSTVLSKVMDSASVTLDMSEDSCDTLSHIPAYTSPYTRGQTLEKITEARETNLTEANQSGRETNLTEANQSGRETNLTEANQSSVPSGANTLTSGPTLLDLGLPTAGRLAPPRLPRGSNDC